MSSLAQFTVPAGGQFDALVHDFRGREQNSYGRVCSRHFGNPGDLDGRMVYYRPEPNPEVGQFQFAIAMQMTQGRKGPQFVSLNTMHPSLAVGGYLQFVTNWLQLTNLSSLLQKGSLLYYAQDGILIRSERVSLDAGQRLDLPGHAVGADFVGMVEWRPDSDLDVFLFRNVRYLFDNPGQYERFDTAFQLEGMVGSGEELLVPVDTVNRSSVIEVMNTSDGVISVDVDVVGAATHSRRVVLPAYGSQHIVLDEMLGPIQIAYARIKSDTPRSVAAVAMHYGRRPDLGITYMFGLPAKPALGTTLRGSYNTYLGQDNWLLTVSPQSQNVSVRMTRPDGSERHHESYSMQGVSALYLNQFETPDTYGVLRVEPAQRNSVVSWALRVKGQEYIIPTPVR
jgi:hypothetical protein